MNTAVQLAAKALEAAADRHFAEAERLLDEAAKLRSQGDRENDGDDDGPGLDAGPGETCAVGAEPGHGAPKKILLESFSVDAVGFGVYLTNINGAQRSPPTGETT